MPRRKGIGDDDDGSGAPLGGFKARLYQARRDKGWSQSELARRVWGEMEDKRGYMVAKNRDRISAYESGRSVPERSNLDAIAEALGMSVSELAPDLVMSNPHTLGSDPTGVSIKMVPGGMAHLRIDCVVSSSVAMAVAELIQPSMS